MRHPQHLEAAFNAIYLPNEEMKYYIEQHGLGSNIYASFYTRGRWWYFEFSDREFADIQDALSAIKSHIEANAVLTTMYGS